MQRGRYDDTVNLRSQRQRSGDLVLIHNHLFSPCSATANRTKMKIAVLTSGGDSAGMNAVVRGVVRAGIVKFAVSFSFFHLYNDSLTLAHPLTRFSASFAGDARLGSSAKGTKASYAETMRMCNCLRTITLRYPRTFRSQIPNSLKTCGLEMALC